MFSRISLLIILLCSSGFSQSMDAPPVSAESPYLVGELLVLTQDTESEKTKWIVPEGYTGSILQTRTQLATIPSQSGTMEFIFVEVGESITYTRIDVTIHKTAPPSSISSKPKKTISPPPKLENAFSSPIKKKSENPFGDITPDPVDPDKSLRKTAAFTNDPLPILIMYTAPFDCPACDMWKKDVYPKLSVGGWKYAEEKTGQGIKAFPSFEVRLGDKRTFHEGYLTMAQINSILEGLK